MTEIFMQYLTEIVSALLSAFAVWLGFELKKLAQQIFSNGSITETYHQSYGTNDPAITHGDEWATVLDGGVAYTVECEGLPVKYVIHMTGFEVSEIIEEVFK